MDNKSTIAELQSELQSLRQRIAELEARNREHEWLEEELSKAVYHDTLTGLPNHELLFNNIHQALAIADRNNAQVAVVCFSIDQFKLISDNLGEMIGDLLIKSVAVRLGSCLRKRDILARPGRGEFLVLLPEVDREEVVRIAERIFAAMETPILLQDQQLVVTASIGISIHPDNGTTAKALVRRAYTAMYRAREQGRNVFSFYSPRLNERDFKRLLMENSLRNALQSGEFFLHYQPQVELDSGRIVGVEALLRWNHPEFGSVSPAEFIPIAEDIGLIAPLSEWVLRSACAQNRAFQEAGFPPICMAVNLSPRQLHDKDLVDTVARVLAETGLEARFLEFELTEGALVRNVATTAATFGVLNSMGIKIAIDDFGTGYSSLSYLRYFPISKLKIDKTFVDCITTDQHNAAIARSIIALAKSLQLSVIAEGVESSEQLEFLHELGCNEVQGFHISHPVSAAELLLLLAARAESGWRSNGAQAAGSIPLPETVTAEKAQPAPVE